MKDKLEIFCDPEFKDLPQPRPAREFMPQWWTALERRVPTNNSMMEQKTVKRCVPVFDAMTAGYIIPWPGKLEVAWDGRQWEATSEFLKVEEHESFQVGTQNYTNSPILKVISPWSYRTPPGWSLMFTEPIWRNSPFAPITGIVDTDTYNVRVNFPMTIRSHGLSVVDVGDPMIQVIPIKRQDWNLKVTYDNETHQQQNRKLNMYDNGYRKNWWSRKSYR